MSKSMQLVATSIVASCLFASCGTGNHNRSLSDSGVVARVGSDTLDLATVRHWMGVLSPTQQLPDPPRYSHCIKRERRLEPLADEAGLRSSCQEQYVAAQKRTLSFLITLAWLKEENVRMGLAEAPAEENPSHTLSGSASSSLYSAAGPEQQRLLEKAQSDISRLRAAVIRKQPKITPTRVALYYKENRHRFERVERREVNLVEQLPSAAAARRLLASLKRSGTSIHSLIGRPGPDHSLIVHEVRGKPPNFAAQSVVWHAIFSAYPHVLVGPLPLFHGYTILEVIRSIPAYRPSLATLSKKIGSQLQAEQDKRVVDAFVRSWRKRWKERTVCDERYMVEQCRDDPNAGGPEDEFAAHVITEGIERAYLWLART
jgi:foldase protein PrsA